MILLRALGFLLLSLLPAQAFWQSRDSNSNKAIGGVGPAAPWIQVLAGTGGTIVSGSPTVLTSTADVPAGSTIVMAVNLGANSNEAVVNCADNAPLGSNTYVVSQPAATAGVITAALCYSINTTNDIPAGSVWIVNIANPAHSYTVRGAWYVTGYNGGLDQSVSVNQATPGTSVASVATTTLANVADLAIGYVFPNAGVTGTITESPLFHNLFNNSFNSIGYDAVTSTATLTYAPSWTPASAYSAVLLTFLPTGAVGGCTEATTFLARTALTGADVQYNAYTNLICGLVTDGIWSKLDGLYVYATKDTTTANLNLKSTSFSPATTNGVCTFTANTGYLGNGTSCYQDTGWAPNAGGTQYTLNSASVGACDLTSRTTNAVAYLAGTVNDVAGFTDFTAIVPLSAGVVNYGVNNGFATPTNTNAQGTWFVSRTTSTLTTLYHNGVSLSTNTEVATALSSQTLLFMAYHRAAVVQSFLADRVAYSFFGGGLTGTDTANLHNRMHTYLAAVGAPAGC